MKKSILFLMLIAAIGAGAQKYVPFPTENAEWNVHCIPNTTISAYVKKYYIHGDTLINNKIYKKLFTKESFWPYPTYLGGIREENKRIYYYSEYIDYGYNMGIKSNLNKIKECLKQQQQQMNTNEVILYDFNRNSVSDTLYNTFQRGYILTIDSILIQNQYRKRYTVPTNYITVGSYPFDYVIEGIGSVRNGILGSLTRLYLCSEPTKYELISFIQNNQVVYKNPAYKNPTETARWDDIDFLKTGTQWYYGKTYYYTADYNPKYSVISYASKKSAGDTLINGQLCHKINKVVGNTVCDPFSNSILYQSNDSLFFQRSDNKQFSLLNVYGAHKGDSWITRYSAQNSVKTIVDSTTQISINGHNLNKLYVRYTNPASNDANGGFHSVILEGMGDTTYLFQSERMMSVCDDLFDITNGLRCFNHPDFGYYHVPGTLDCAYVTDVPDNRYKTLRVFIHKNTLTVADTERYSFQVDLMDVKGTTMVHAMLTSNQNTLDITNLDKGIYLYRISANGIMLRAGKVVKQ